MYSDICPLSRALVIYTAPFFDAIVYGVLVCASTALDVRTDMMKSTHNRLGRLDILVNNVGIQFVSPMHTFPEDKSDAIIAVCLSAAFHSTKAVLPVMLEQGWGRLTNTGSMHALVASPYKSACNAAKHGIAGFPRSTEQDPEF